MNKVLIGVVCGALVLMSLPFAAALVVALAAAAAETECQQQTPLTPPMGTGQVRIAQANIKVSLSAPQFQADLSTVIDSGADLISLNETTSRSQSELTRPGYGAYRAPNHGKDGTAVLWRTDTWTQTEAGRVVMVANGPQKWDADRGATWVTLQKADGSQVTMISLHHMINPGKYGPNMPERQRLYGEGLDKVTQLVAEKSALGPVFVAGDFNVQYTQQVPWGPRAKLGAIGMKPTFDTFGRLETHDGGGSIDFVYYQTSAATPTTQSTAELNSDHNMVLADFTLGSTAANSSTQRTVTAPGAAQVVPAVAGRGTTPNAALTSLMQLRLAANSPTLTQQQARNVVAIAAAAREAQVSRRGLQVALATAIQESKLVNLDHGDRDSAGLFQQRPSQGWGTKAQVMNPALAARAFFGRADHTHNTGLLQVPGWEAMSVTEAAQAVQKSGTPTAYAQWEQVAGDMADLVGSDLATTSAMSTTSTSSNPDCPAPIPAGSCPATGSPAEAGLTPDALNVLRAVEATFGHHSYSGVGERSTNPTSDHPAGRAVDVMIEGWQGASGITEGDKIAAWVREHATELGVTYVIWRAKIWSTGDTAWRPYSHPSGATDPTSLHMGHVHVSVVGTAGTGACGGAVGDVVYPVPANLAGTDRHNWGSSGGNWSSWHTGTDFSVGCGTPVLAAHAGTIEIDTTQGWAGPWLVKVTTGPNQLTTWYAHMQKVTVARGQQVTPGQPIGEVGNKGNVAGATGCHLHFEVHEKNGSIYGPDNVNASTWLAQHVTSGG